MVSPIGGNHMKQLILPALLLASPLLTACEPETPRTVTVQAEGSAVSQATHAIVRLDAGARGETPDGALEGLQTLYTSLRQTLPQLEGLDSIEFQTLRLELEQICPRDRDFASYSPQGITCEGGYHTAVQTVIITLSPAEKAGNLASLANELGVVSLGLIQFTSTEPDVLQDTAMEQALQVARQSAERIARSSDLHLGQIVSVQPSVTRQAPPELSAPAEDAIPPAPPHISPRQSIDVAPGEVRSTASITVVYELVEEPLEN